MIECMKKSEKSHAHTIGHADEAMRIIYKSQGYVACILSSRADSNLLLHVMCIGHCMFCECVCRSNMCA